MAPTDKPTPDPQFNVRPDKAQWDTINWLKAKYDFGNKELLERVLKWIEKMKDHVNIDMIFENEPINLLLDIHEDVHDLSWGNHAFNVGVPFSGWSLQEFYRLYRRVKARPRSGIYRFVNYRLGYSWSNLARLLRLRAIESLKPIEPDGRMPAPEKSKVLWAEQFRLADQSLRYAIAHEEIALQDTEHPVCRFNLACEWSKRGMFFIEERLLRLACDGNEGQKKWATNILKGINTSSLETAERLAVEWRANLEQADAAVVDQCAERAMGHLEKVRVDDRNGWVDASFLGIHAKRTDLDLLLLRYHVVFGSKFAIWENDVACTHAELINRIAKVTAFDTEMDKLLSTNKGFYE